MREIACERAFDFYTLQSKKIICANLFDSSQDLFPTEMGADQKVQSNWFGHQQLLGSNNSS